MISHVVLFRPRQDLQVDERRALIDAFARAVREIPSVRAVRVGRRVRHGAGYEATSPDLADVFIAIDFDDVDGLQAYLRHPAHEELGACFNQAMESGVVYDFEVGNGLELFET